METVDLKGREIESVEYSENGLVVKLKPMKFEPKDGDFIYQMDSCCEWTSIFKKETDRYSNKLDVHVCFVINTNGEGFCLKIQSECRKVSVSSTFRLATDSEKQQRLNSLAKAAYTWNAEKKRVEKLRWRAKKHESYYYIDDEEVTSSEEEFFKIDNTRFNLGNYYQTKEQAKAAFEEIKLVYAKNL